MDGKVYTASQDYFLPIVDKQRDAWRCNANQNENALHVKNF